MFHKHSGKMGAPEAHNDAILNTARPLRFHIHTLRLRIKSSEPMGDILDIKPRPRDNRLDALKSRFVEETEPPG